MPAMGDWDKYEGTNWQVGVTKITTPTGDPGWTCYRKGYITHSVITDLSDSFKYTDTDGICMESATGGVAPNYSQEGTSEYDCYMQCLGQENCIGYSFHTDARGNRCAIW
eukprot:UN26259